jgi:hypothetical protein
MVQFQCFRLFEVNGIPQVSHSFPDSLCCQDGCLKLIIYQEQFLCLKHGRFTVSVSHKEPTRNEYEQGGNKPYNAGAHLFTRSCAPLGFHPKTKHTATHPRFLVPTVTLDGLSTTLLVFSILQKWNPQIIAHQQSATDATQV